MPSSVTANPELAGRTFERILLIKPSSLGDVIHALPVLNALRRKFPVARIDWLISTSLAPLLQGHKDITDLVLFDRKRLGRLATSPRAAGALVGFVRALREKQYDLVIDLQGLFRTGFFAWASGAAVRLGFADAREGASLFYTHRGADITPETHAADRNWRLAQTIGLDDAALRFDLQLTDSDRDDVKRQFVPHGLDESTRLVAVLPGARWDTKVWLPERFVATIDELHASGDVRCVLLGGESERERCRSIREACREKPIDLCGLTPLRTLAATLERADAILCHDSGPMHMAVALDRPVVCIIGPTNPTRTGPYRRPESVVRLDLDCAPCYLRKLSQCRFEHACMRDLQTRVVVEAVRRSLAQTPRSVETL